MYHFQPRAPPPSLPPQPPGKPPGVPTTDSPVTPPPPLSSPPNYPPPTAPSLPSPSPPAPAFPSPSPPAPALPSPSPPAPALPSVAAEAASGTAISAGSPNRGRFASRQLYEPSCCNRRAPGGRLRACCLRALLLPLLPPESRARKGAPAEAARRDDSWAVPAAP